MKTSDGKLPNPCKMRTSKAWLRNVTSGTQRSHVQQMTQTQMLTDRALLVHLQHVQTFDDLPLRSLLLKCCRYAGMPISGKFSRNPCRRCTAEPLALPKWRGHACIRVMVYTSSRVQPGRGDELWCTLVEDFFAGIFSPRQTVCSCLVLPSCD